jgi:hypothetical protein
MDGAAGIIVVGQQRMRLDSELGDTGAEKMLTMTLDAEAGQLSEELARRGVPPRAVVHVTVELADAVLAPLAAAAQAGGAFAFLNDEPDMYSDADMVDPACGAKDGCTGAGIVATDSGVVANVIAKSAVHELAASPEL